MMINQPVSMKHLSLITALIAPLLFPATLQAAAAGKVVFATGSASAVNASGASRSLRRGDEVFSGDSLRTSARSRLQVSFADGAYISVQPSSEYKIENYNYSGKEDGSERAFYRLLKGGIRAVTGYIGKRNRESYRVSTAVATIGIRGTGHNTRICDGDCPGKKDGLYHSTWEGETVVQNDVDSRNVPAGNGVYVEDIDTKIIPTNQPDGATAVDTASKEREKQEEEEESNALVSTGNQRTSDDGLQTVVVEDQEVIDELENPFGDPTFSEVDDGLVLQGVLPDVDDPEGVDAPAFTDVSIFSTSDGKPIAILGNEEDDDGGTVTNFEVFATIDPAAALGVNDPAALELVEEILAAADPDKVDLFLQMPASVAEAGSTNEGLSVARWSDGRVLSVDRNLATNLFEETNVDELTGYQSIHFIYGDTPGPIPTSGGALYQFTIGTQSTSVSGDTIGIGVTAGSISVTFSTSDAFISMSVDHDSTLYNITGNLMIDGASLQDTSVFAFTTAPGSACNPNCETFIDGGFAGPASPSMPSMPNNIGIEYDIQDTDVVTGVAGFSYELVGP